MGLSHCDDDSGRGQAAIRSPAVTQHRIRDDSPRSGLQQREGRGRSAGRHRDETRQVLARIEALLAAAGSDKSRLLKATIYLASASAGDFAAMNGVRDAWGRRRQPARAHHRRSAAGGIRRFVAGAPGGVVKRGSARSSAPGDVVSSAIDVWFIALDATQAQSREAASLLAPAERARRDRLQDPRDARRFADRRVALRRVLARYVGAEPAALPLLAGPDGKPILSAAPHFPSTRAAAAT